MKCWVNEKIIHPFLMGYWGLFIEIKGFFMIFIINKMHFKYYDKGI